MFGNDSTIFQFRGPFGIPIEIGSSLILLAFIFIRPFGDTENIVQNAVFFALILLAIFLHEMGHAWGTLIQGHSVKRVVIYGGGGFCESTRALPRSEEEFVVVMGPIVNLGLWALASLAVPLVAEIGFFQIAVYCIWFANINIFLFFLNMIPVQPLDGGKLLFLTLRRFMERMRAIRVAGFIGLVFAVLWIPAMIYCFIALGFLLLFMPSIATHWRMFRGKKI